MEKDKSVWSGRSLTVEVLHSVAGVAQSILVGGDESFLLVDAGDGALRDILASNHHIDELTGIIFTHGHYDHVGGLYSLLGFLRMMGRGKPLRVVAPEGCTEVLSTVNGFSTRYLDTIPFELSLMEIRAWEVTGFGEMSVEAYPVVHCGSVVGEGILAPLPAMGYRISRRGESVAISGDTGRCESLLDLVEGADLAIIEATFPDNNAVDKEYLERVHLSEELAAEIGQSAKEFILVHKRRRKDG